MASGRSPLFPKKRLSKDQVVRLRGWKKDSSLSMPPPKRVRRFDAVPSNPASPCLCCLSRRFGIKGCSKSSVKLASCCYGLPAGDRLSWNPMLILFFGVCFGEASSEPCLF